MVAGINTKLSHISPQLRAIIFVFFFHSFTEWSVVTIKINIFAGLRMEKKSEE